MLVHDCDPGIDDAFALAALVGLGAAPDAIVAVGGNVGLAVTARNAAGLAALLGLSVPVGIGAADAIAGTFPGTAAEVHADDGMGGAAAHLPAAAPTVVDGIGLLTGTVLATGPLTDVALALRAGNAIDEVVWMGGGLAEGGNVTPAAEFNAWCDPEAVELVIASGVPLKVIPLDVTHQVPLTEADVARLEAVGPAGLPFAIAGRFLQAARTAFLHDPVAAVALLRPELFRWEALDLHCETAGMLTRGMTVGDRRPGRTGRTLVALGVDAPAVHDLILDGRLPRHHPDLTRRAGAAGEQHRLEVAVSDAGRCSSVGRANCSGWGR